MGRELEKSNAVSDCDIKSDPDLSLMDFSAQLLGCLSQKLSL